MGSIVGQIAFNRGRIDPGRVAAALSKDPWGATARFVTESASVGIAVCRAPSDAGDTVDLPTDAPTVALDGQVHAPDALAKALGEQRPLGGAALFARALQRWGETAPERIQGDFAVACYRPEEGRALLIRDHIGTRPLHWHWDGNVGALSFATFLPTLLALLPVRPGPDEAAIAAYLRWPTAIGDRTFFAGVRAVEPGHLIALDAQGPRVRRWWRPEAVRDIRFKDARDYGEAARELAERAVTDRLPGVTTNIPVGAHLSGGLDSTAVALIAQEALRARGHGLTGGYIWSPALSAADPEIRDDKTEGATARSGDERPNLLRLCADAGIPPRFGGAADQRAFLSRPFELEGLADVLDEFPILAAAQADGAHVLLSGWGADEAFSAHAYGAPASLLARGRIGALLGLIRRANRGFRPLSRSGSLLWHHAIVPTLPGPLYNRFQPYADFYGEGCYIGERLKALPLDDRVYRRFRYSTDTAADIRDHLALGHIGERMASWAAWGAPYGIEYRYPLTDRRLIEFVLGIPPEILWGDGRPRYLARATLRGRVKVPLGKADPANERKRRLQRKDTAELLARDARAGAFDGTCDWLDMERLRADLLKGPTGDDTADVLAAIRVNPAVRVWHMAERFGAIERPPQRKTA